MTKNLITKNTLNKRNLAESSVLYIFKSDIITPGAQDLIKQKNYKCKYINKEELEEIIKQISAEMNVNDLKEDKISKIINRVLKI